MPGRVAGKVAFVTGAARGQGRSHAARLAEEGANIVAVDICADIPNVSYAMGTRQDLADTVSLIESHGQSVIAEVADVRDRGALMKAAEAGAAEFGQIDIVVANAAIMPLGGNFSTFSDVIDINLTGVINTVDACLGSLADGGSIVITSSMAALTPGAMESESMGGGGLGYGWSKRNLLTYASNLAALLAPRFIRVNVILPCCVNTPMLHQQALYNAFRPDLENPTVDDVRDIMTGLQSIPVPWIEPLDTSNAVLFLASDEARYITGQQLQVDAGLNLKL